MSTHPRPWRSLRMPLSPASRSRFALQLRFLIALTFSDIDIETTQLKHCVVSGSSELLCIITHLSD